MNLTYILICRFLAYIIAHMYVANPQARVGGLEYMDLDCLPTLQKNGFISTSHFKTAATYGYQTIVVCPSTLRLLEYWVRYFRPTVVVSDSGQRLFLNSSGKPHTSLGRLLTEFFRPHGLHITTQAIRYVFLIFISTCFLSYTVDYLLMMLQLSSRNRK
jgi:hypothetical protein